MSDKPIGVYDSGFGGLTVLESLRRNLPNETFIYFGDNLRSPYGSKSENEILEYALQVGRLLYHEHDIKMLVVACNTATAVALSSLREVLPIPVVGVIEPGLRAAEERTATKRVLVASTEATRRSLAYQKINASAGTLTIEVMAFPGLVDIVETHQTGTIESFRAVKSRLDETDYVYDTVLLGCTHFPYLYNEFVAATPLGTNIVDSAEQTVLSVKDLLEPATLPPSETRFLSTGDVEGFRKKSFRTLNLGSAMLISVAGLVR